MSIVVRTISRPAGHRPRITTRLVEHPMHDFYAARARLLWGAQAEQEAVGGTEPDPKLYPIEIDSMQFAEQLIAQQDRIARREAILRSHQDWDRPSRRVDNSRQHLSLADRRVGVAAFKEGLRIDF